MANSKQRRHIERAVASALDKLLQKHSDKQLPLPINPPLPESRSLDQRLLFFFEQPLLLAPATVVAGLIGVLVWSPILIVCGGCFVAALHRSGLVSGRSKRTQVIVYAVWILFVAWGLFAVDRLITKSAQAYVGSLVENVISKLPKQQQMTTVVPAPAAPVLPPHKIERPLIVVTQTSAEYDEGQQMLAAHFEIEDASTTPTKLSLSYSATVDGIPTAAILTDMPRKPVQIAGGGHYVLNMYFQSKDDKTIAKDIWEGHRQLAVSIKFFYDGKTHVHVARFDKRIGRFIILEAN